MERHHLSSIEVANFLEAHPKIITVNHPLLKSSLYRSLALTQHGGRHSGMLAFYLKGGRSEAVTFLDKTKIIKRAASLGGTHSLASHPRSLTHNAKLVPEAEAEAAGITENLIRLSVGLENVQDLMADLEQALAQIWNVKYFIILARILVVQGHGIFGYTSSILNIYCYI